MPKVLELECFSECDTSEKVDTMLNEILGAEATLKSRIAMLYTYIGVRFSSYCGKPLSDADEYNFAIEQVVTENAKRKNK